MAAGDASTGVYADLQCIAIEPRTPFLTLSLYRKPSFIIVIIKAIIVVTSSISVITTAIVVIVFESCSSYVDLDKAPNRHRVPSSSSCASRVLWRVPADWWLFEALSILYVALSGRFVILSYFLWYYVPLAMVRLPSVIAAWFVVIGFITALHCRRGPWKALGFVLMAAVDVSTSFIISSSSSLTASHQHYDRGSRDFVSTPMTSIITIISSSSPASSALLYRWRSL